MAEHDKLVGLEKLSVFKAAADKKYASKSDLVLASKEEVNAMLDEVFGPVTSTIETGDNPVDDDL